jgi:hypothetical protein
MHLSEVLAVLNTALLAVIAFLLLVIALPQLMALGSWIWHHGGKSFLGLCLVFLALWTLSTYPVQSWAFLKNLPRLALLIGGGWAIWFIADRLFERIKRIVSKKSTLQDP